MLKRNRGNSLIVKLMVALYVVVALYVMVTLYVIVVGEGRALQPDYGRS